MTTEMQKIITSQYLKDALIAAQYISVARGEDAYVYNVFCNGSHKYISFVESEKKLVMDSWDKYEILHNFAAKISTKE